MRAHNVQVIRRRHVGYGNPERFFLAVAGQSHGCGINTGEAPLHVDRIHGSGVIFEKGSVPRFIINQQFLHPLALADISDKSQHDFLAALLYYAGVDLHGNAASVPAGKLQLIGSREFAVNIILQYLCSTGKAIFGEDIQFQEVLADKLFTLITNNLFAPAVAVKEVAFEVVYIDAVRGILQGGTQLFLALA